MLRTLRAVAVVLSGLMLVVLGAFAYTTKLPTDMQLLLCVGGLIVGALLVGAGVVLYLRLPPA